jgi:hypothetical protein
MVGGLDEAVHDTVQTRSRPVPGTVEVRTQPSHLQPLQERLNQPQVLILLQHRVLIGDQLRRLVGERQD